MMAYRSIKPKLDFIGAIILLVTLFPLILLTSFLVLVFMGYPIVYSQERIGRNGVSFKIYKFRSMIPQKKNAVEQIPDEKRITRLGQFLRRFSLDELPQILNILKGEMSFIGPRALLPEYLVHYTEIESRRHQVVPGISGLSQIRGRNCISWKNRFRYDLFYVNHFSFRLDLLIFFLTFKEIFFSTKVMNKGAGLMIPMTQRSANDRLN